MPSDSFIAALPKTDIHLHLVGSASVDTVLILAQRRPDVGVPTDRESLASYYKFTDFAHFIEVHGALNRLLGEPDDLVTLVVGAARDASACNARWIELTVTASIYLAAGFPAEEIRQALESGARQARADYDVEIGWIFDIPGEFGLSAADATVQFMTDYAPSGTLAIGLAGIEQDVPRSMFAAHIAQARALGYRAVIHAGESTGAATVRSALDDLGADRIGHGIRAVDDRDLLAQIVRERIPLEVCVTSNLCTNVVASMAEHPIHALLAAGANVVLATDDPGMFDTDLNREYRRVADAAHLQERELRHLATASIESSFAPEQVKTRLLAELDRLA